MRLRAGIKISQATKEVFGFYVGIDPKHVEWRLQDALDSRSADFMHAGWALRTMFSKLFNPAARSMNEDLDVEMEDAAPQGWEHIWKAWLLNERVTASVKVGRDTAAAFQRALKGDAADAARFRQIGAYPACLLSNFLTLMGCKKRQSLCGMSDRSKTPTWQSSKLSHSGSTKPSLLGCVRQWLISVV